MLGVADAARRGLVLVGFSNGGLVAAEFALAHPELTAGLVLASAAVTPDQAARLGVMSAAFPVVVTVGTREGYFGGPLAMMRDAARFSGTVARRIRRL